jgi:hypothetical protein
VGVKSKLKAKLTLAVSLLQCTHSWMLIFKAPRTLSILLGTLVKPRSDDLWAFSPVDAVFRNWYKKIASDYKSQGRFGFAWDDGLGMALGPRIYNNWATYVLLDYMGTRTMALFSLTTFVLSSFGIVYLHFGLIPAFLFALLALVSPLFVGLHSHVWKAEFFWWGGGVVFCYLALIQPGLEAGLLWSAIAMVNLPASVMLALFTAPFLLFTSLDQGSFILLGLGVLPGVIKHAFRIYGAWRSGFLSLLVSEQSRLWKRPWFPVSSELVIWAPFLLAIMSGSYAGGAWEVPIIICGTGIFLYWANFRLIYINDAESFHFCLWALGLSMACLNGSWLGLVAMLAFAYTSPTLFGFPVSNDYGNSSDRWTRLANEASSHFRKFPGFEPIPYPLPKALQTFFDLIPDGARILAESDGDPRIKSKFRNFWMWSEGLLPLRKIDLVNEMYTRMNEPDLADVVLSRFNSKDMPQEEMLNTLLQLGVSYVVSWTDESKDSLCAAGFIVKGILDLAELGEFRRIIPCPPVKLYLLKNPHNVGIIAPITQWSRKSNELLWTAESGKNYKVLYRYHSNFVAEQGGKILPIGYYFPFPEFKLRFMSVTAISNGPLALRFKG